MSAWIDSIVRGLSRTGILCAYEGLGAVSRAHTILDWIQISLLVSQITLDTCTSSDSGYSGYLETLG